MSNDTSSPAAITEAMTVNDVLQQQPQVLPVLHELGVHTCCGGGLTLAVAAANAGIDVKVLIDRVSRAIEQTPAR